MENKTYPFWKVSSHTFLLGAGASRAAFPNGDKNGRELPLMNDFIEIVGLIDFFDDNDIEVSDNNIEEIYDNLYRNDPESELIKELNDRIIDYFSILEIPDEVTLYDELILSSQKKDVIFSFNWDPLLLQAYSRNSIMEELPSLHFLHGNVAIGVCIKDKHCGHIDNNCSICNEQFIPSKLLFPIRKKNYNMDPFIYSEWTALNHYLDNSFIFSIFGYGAPASDIEAREIMLHAWRKNKRNELNEIDIIDIKPRNEVEENWSDFIFKSHGGIYTSIRETQPFRYARRSCESWGDAIMQGIPWSENNLPEYKCLDDLQNWVKPLINEEIVFREKDVPIKMYRV